MTHPTPNPFLVASAKFPDSSAKDLLYRGGQSLRVEPLPDRFTVTLASEKSIEALINQLTEQLNPEAVRIEQEIPAVGTELWVKSDFLQTAIELAQISEAVLYISPVYQPSHSSGTPIYLTNQLTILFAPSVTAEQMQSIATQAGLRVFKLVPGVPKAFVFHIEPQEALVNPLHLAQQLMHHPEVLLAEPNIVVNLRAPTSPYLSSEQRTDPLGLTSAWQYSRGNPSVVIAVATAKIDLNQLIFQNRRRIVAPLLESGYEIRNKVEDEDEASQESCIDWVARIAPECSVMPIEIGSFLEDGIVEKICEWVIEQEASVLLWEWATSLANYPLSLRQQSAITRAATKGQRGGCVIGVVDAGQHQMNGFAIHPDVLSIVATPLAQDQSKPQPARISICAPTGEPYGENPGAIVTGIAAMVRAVNPNLTARQVKQLLQGTADKVVALDMKSERPSETNWTYDAFGYSPRFGYGQVNALRAIEAALQTAYSPVELAPQPVQLHWIESQIAEPLEIPDGNPQGVMTSFQVSDLRPISQIEVSVEIEHSFMGDLEIYLIPPTLLPLLLQSRTAGRVNILRKTYTPNTTPCLKTLIHQPARGRWQLHLIDRVPQHIGSLKRWSLRLGIKLDRSS